jgi:predicted peptidase
VRVLGSNRSASLVVSSALLVFVLGCASRGPDERFQRMTYVSPTGPTLPYRLFVPDAGDTNGRYPLVVFLHGGRGSGTDNLKQISGTNYSGSHVWIQRDCQTKHRALVVAPQLPELRRWDYTASDELSTYGELVVELIRNLQDKYPIDQDRIYLTGQSLGGWGVWDLIAKRPELFAAAVPVCGGGNPKAASSMRDVSIWAFHGAEDREVSVERSREMVKALRAAGSDVKYTEYRSAGHAIWDRAYGEDGLIDWLFAQRKRP